MALDVTYQAFKLIPEQKSRSDAIRHDPSGNGELTQTLNKAE